jgi:DNA-binding Xre family transcriptional regulator
MRHVRGILTKEDMIFMIAGRLDFLMLEYNRKPGQKVTMRELSAATGLPLGTLARYKGGKPLDRIYVESVEALCRFFGCGLCDLLEYRPDQGAHSRENAPS